jgi:hypothetical protein
MRYNTGTKQFPEMADFSFRDGGGNCRRDRWNVYMVAVQEEQKYGRPSGRDSGPLDFVKYAEAFGAQGS